MRGRARIADVNMTPLVDVMLVVLVLFLITSPLLLPGPDVTLPKVYSDALPVEDADAVITVKRDGSVYYKHTRVLGDLSAVLTADAAFVQSRRIYVRGDGEATFGDVSAVLLATERAAAKGVNLVMDHNLLDEGERR